MNKITFNSKPGQYTYTNDTTHSKTAYGVVPDGNYRAGSRNTYAMKKAKDACISDYQEGDERGHLMPHGKGGADDSRNISAQHKDVNHGSQSIAETEIRNASKSPENTVFVSVTNSSSNSTRPDATMITMASQDSKGNIDVKYMGFQNASYADQQSWNDTVQSQANDIDFSQEAGLLPDERSLADSRCGEEVSFNMFLGNCSYFCNDISSVFDDCSYLCNDSGLSADGSDASADGFTGSLGALDSGGAEMGI